MQGGYQDDRWLQGGSNAGAYRIWHWRLIDIFVYFSHHLVTIPPAGWTNAAHRHGVKVKPLSVGIVIYSFWACILSRAQVELEKCYACARERDGSGETGSFSGKMV
jgi:endo-beta-N-acetylglucosaminidase D